MKVITHKQMKSAFERVAGMLHEDGETETRTVGEWLDVAASRPTHFANSLSALEILGLLGFGNETVQPRSIG